MKSDYWIKLYHEILDDPKMMKLPDHLFRRVIELFLIAGETHEEGNLPSIDDMAWRLRTDMEELETDLIELQQLNIVSYCENTWMVTKFAERQARVEDAERMRMYREKKHKQQYYGDDTVKPLYTTGDDISNDIVTICNVEQDKDIDTDIDSSSCSSGENPEKTPEINIFQLYEANIGMIVPMIADELKDIEKSYPPNWVEDAFLSAVDHNVRKLSYVKGVLRNRANGTDNRRSPPGGYVKVPVETPGQKMLREQRERIEKGLSP